MPFTYQWQNLLDIAKKNIRNIPTTDVDARYCDLVSQKMAQVGSWRPLNTTIPPATILLQNNVQDYTVPNGIYRLKSARITRTDVTPNPEWELDVRNELPSDLTPNSPTGISNIAHQPSEGVLRLNSAVQIVNTVYNVGATSAVRLNNYVTVTIPTGHTLVVGEAIVVAGMGDNTMNATSKQVAAVVSSTKFTYQSIGTNGTSGGGTVTAWPYEVRGSIDINPTKITATTQQCWFDDKYADVALSGLTYWYFLLGGDTRAGNTTTDSKGNVAYTGQLGVFYSKLQEMKEAEQLQDTRNFFPSEPISMGRSGDYLATFWGN